MSYVTLAPFVAKRPWLQNALRPLANWYANASGYRQMGLRYDDAPPHFVFPRLLTIRSCTRRLGPTT